MDSGYQFADVTWPLGTGDLYAAVYRAAALFQLLWLGALVLLRIAVSGRSPERKTVMFLPLVALAVPVTAGPVMQQLQLPGMNVTTGLLLRTVLLAWLACEVCLHHGIPLSRSLSSDERLHRWRTAAGHTEKVGIYCAIGTTLTMAAVLMLRWIGPDGMPVMRTSQTSALGADSPTDLFLTLPWVIVLEGVVIGTVALLLHTAGRPTWQIYTTVAVPEIIFHAYFGVPAVLMGVYALLCTRFYLRYHRLGPLLLGHALYDVIGLLLAYLPFLYRIALGFALMTACTAVERWLPKKKPLHPALDKELSL
ncbi:hypothetical protein [Streptomyces apricus]|nr:hypothetical protein [Streptomyces apricus]